MKSSRITRLAALATVLAIASPAAVRAAETVGRVVRTDAEWKARLSPLAYDVLRHAGTERAFTGRYWNEHRKGIYRCAGCGLTLFASATKYESGTGWPSFWKPIDPTHVKLTADRSIDGAGSEVVCARCGGHLGHVFDDGPPPTGQRYCMNSVSLDFVPAK